MNRLSDGSTVMALVPQVYLMPREGDLTPTGSLLAGAQVQLDLSGDLIHAGTIAGRELVRITAQNIHLLGGRTSGEAVDLRAHDSLNLIGGQVVAQDQLSLQADGDINIRSTTQSTGDASTSNATSSSSRTTLDRVAALYVTNPGGTLVAMAGGNLTAQGAAIRSEGNVTLQALGEIALSTLTTEARDEARWDEQNHLSLTERNEIGSTVTAAGQINLQAGGGITARAANLQADGDLALQAGGSVLIEAGERAKAHDEAHHVESSGWLSSSSTTTRNAANETQAMASSLGGRTVSIRSDADTTLVGSNVIGDQGVSIEAEGDVNIMAAQTRFSQSEFKEVETSGFSFGDGSVSWGSQGQSKAQKSQGTGAAASTVGAITGNVSITTGKTYTQVGSDVLAPGGDIDIDAQSVQITEARETLRTQTKETMEQSGITLGVSTPLLTAMQSVASQMEAANDSKDSRMQGLAAANSAFAIHNALNQAADGSSKPDASAAQQAGGVNVSISIGSSSSESKTLETSDTARGSTVSAAGSVSITASGKGKDSGILIRGSDISAGTNASLSAEGDVNLLAAQNTANPIDGYETYTPKYFPCATAECVRGGQNLDMSDPETRAYVMALDKKILDDIGKASTVVVVANPLGASGTVASAVGPLTSLASGMLEDRELRALFKEGLQAAAQAYIHRVYGLPQQVAARLVGVVDLAGGWQAFVDRSTSNIKQR